MVSTAAPAEAIVTTSALDTQEGGDHYRDMKIQPVEFITKNQIPFIEGCVIKYVCRHRSKNKAQDIKKAIHFLNLLLELEYSETSRQAKQRSVLDRDYIDPVSSGIAGGS